VGISAEPESSTSCYFVATRLDLFAHGSFARFFNSANARPARRPSLVAVESSSSAAGVTNPSYYIKPDNKVLGNTGRSRSSRAQRALHRPKRRRPHPLQPERPSPSPNPNPGDLAIEPPRRGSAAPRFLIANESSTGRADATLANEARPAPIDAARISFRSGFNVIVSPL
jgi:hypothetical protein